MNQSKISLADVLTFLGAIIFGFITFISTNFLTLGDTATSITVALLISFILGGVAFGVKLIKRTSANFKFWIIGECILLFLYTAIAFFSTIPFSHYFSVTERKVEIQESILSSINKAERMYTDYELYANNRLYMYESLLKSVAAGKDANDTYREYGFVDGTDDNTQIENMMFSLKAKLYPSNYLETKQIATEWLSDSKRKIENWSPIGIIKVVNTLGIEITKWGDQLKENSAYRAKGQNNKDVFDFEFKVNFDDVSEIFLKKKAPTLFSIGLAVVLYAIMLFSYFITKRHTKNNYSLCSRKTVLRKSDIDIKY